MVQYLIQKEAKIVDKRKKSALMAACVRENVRSAILLAKDEYNLISTEGKTALMAAAAAGSLQCLQLVMD